MKNEPSTNGPNGRGRGAGGRFVKGNAGGPGNPFAKHVGELRSALLNAITAADVRKIVQRLVKDAQAGDLGAAKEVLERALGRPLEADLLQRLEDLESSLKGPGHEP